MKFICEDVDQHGNPMPGTGCGEIDHVLFNGYYFGDRLLEDVMFKAFIKDGQLAVASREEWDKDPYLIRLDKHYWLPLALDYAQKNDCAECPKCGSDVAAQPQE